MPESHASARRPSGELEASVLAALWAADGRPLTPADVQRDLVAALGADLARTTVTTILARLHDKGSVSRTRAGRGYAYLPAHDPPGLAARRMRSELDKSAEGQRGTVLARFVSELDPADEELLRSLLGAAEGPDAGEPGTGGGGGAGAERARGAEAVARVEGAGAAGSGGAAQGADLGGPGARAGGAGAAGSGGGAAGEGGRSGGGRG